MRPPAASGATVAGEKWVTLNGNIAEVPLTSSGSGPRIVRTVLTPAETTEVLDFVVSLRMRGVEALQGRINSRQLVSRAEMDDKFLPAAADFQRVASWLEGQGFAVDLKDRNHTNIFARGTIGRISEKFGVSFARVATADGEFTSAVTAPSLPESISAVVLGIVGLQPYIRMHVPRRMTAQATVVSGYVTPSDLASYYQAPTNYDGTGQTIAIIMDAAPLTTDLTTFWQEAGVNDSLSNFNLVNVSGGPSAANQAVSAGEVTLDVEWASAFAPGASVTVYAVPGLTFSSILDACTQIMNDGNTNIVSYSASAPEDSYTVANTQLVSQTLMQMAAQGISVVAASGDGGSNPNPAANGNGYSISNPASVGYPASDPNLTSVGGTDTDFDASWSGDSEAAWSEIGTVATNPNATGGGVSSLFGRPSWQFGNGVPPGTTRCVPDVSAMAQFSSEGAGEYGAFVVLNGKDTGYTGTSLATPIWGGILALVDQYRNSLGLKPAGLLASSVYVLNGGNGFRDVVSGNNGAYQAGPGYDLCTGIGTPRITNLMIGLVEVIHYVGAPANPVAVGSAVTMSVAPQITPSSYQWQLNGVPIAGATAAVYTVANAGAGNAGAYTVILTYPNLGAATYNMGNLTVSGNTTRLINISTRAQVGTGGSILIPGFVISGSGMETLLIRADGPSLAQFGVTGILAQPSLGVYNSSGVLIASNTRWGTNTNPAQISSTASAVGAFALLAGSADCALIISLPAGSYTVEVSGVGDTTGVALAEVYEVSSTGTRLINISTRSQVGTGGNVLIPGFVISGSGTEQLLVRGDGPSLGQFGVSGLLAQPSLSLLSGTSVIASNTGWGTSSSPGQIASIAASVGAFSLVSGGADSALVVSLQPGAYTAEVSGVGGTTGVALAEIYEVP